VIKYLALDTTSLADWHGRLQRSTSIASSARLNSTRLGGRDALCSDGPGPQGRLFPDDVAAFFNSECFVGDGPLVFAVYGSAPNSETVSSADAAQAVALVRSLEFR